MPCHSAVAGMLVRYVALSACMLLVSATRASASAAEPATTQLTVQAVRDRLKRVEDDEKLQQEPKAKLLDLYKKAVITVK